MFGRKKTSPAVDNEVTTTEAAEAPGASAAPQKKGKGSSVTPGKGVPTPKRKDAQAANHRPLIVDDRKAAKKAQREAVAEERAKMRIAMETGDERHMPARDKGPQRRYARDYVDARYGIGEWLMIIVIVMLLLSFIPVPEMQLFITTAMMALLITMILEGVHIGRTLKKQLTEKFGEMEPGVRWYGAMRAMQLRRMRLPKPQVKRGEYPS